jgi:hypothetical protein
LRLGRSKGRRRRYEALHRRRKTVQNAAEIIVLFDLIHLGLASNPLEPLIILLLRLLRRSNQPKIMFGMLQIAFRRDRITRRMRIACQLQIFFGNVIGSTANLYIGTIRFI